MSRRPSLPKKLEKAIFQQFSSRCPFCGETDIAVLQTHHIVPYAMVRKHEADNLILVCANCHDRIEAGGIPRAAVERKKREALAGIKAPLNRPGAGVEVHNSVNHGIIAHTVSVRMSGKGKPASPPPSGTVATNGTARNYAKYLIDRYHKFKLVEVGKAKMNYTIFHVSIKRELGAKWDHVPLSRFADLVAFLQRRIDDTILGKNQKAGGKPNYQTYEGYLEKYGGSPVPEK